MSDRLDHGDKNDETSTDVDTSFSCADCGQEFNSRQELKEHESTQHQKMSTLMSYYGWNGKRDSNSFDVARSLTSTLHALKNTGVQIDFIAQLNDSGSTFDEIADFLDKMFKRY